MSVNPIVILGGGISGLSCAYYLHKFAGPLIAPRKIIVIEGSKHLGGWIKTKVFDDGVIHEIGPKSIRCMGAPGFNTLSLVSMLHNEHVVEFAKFLNDSNLMIDYLFIRLMKLD